MKLKKLQNLQNYKVFEQLSQNLQQQSYIFHSYSSSPLPISQMTQIPRKATFPPYMIQKLITKIQNDVYDDVIPVSTGMYSYEKLKNKLEAIPKPQIQNYEDQIFFQVIQEKPGIADIAGQKCSACEQQYNMKKNPAVMCNFCGIYYCFQCTPARKRPHPLSKDGGGKRYNICHRCDTRYLNLQLSHSYVQNRTLLQQAIVKTSQQLQNSINQCQQFQQQLTKIKQSYQKNKFKVSQLRKEKLQLTKSITNKMPEQLRSEEKKHEKLRVKFVEIHFKHREWLDFHQLRKKEEIERIQKEKHRQREQEQERMQQLQLQRMKRAHQEQEENDEKIEREEKQKALEAKQRKLGNFTQNSTFNFNISTVKQQNSEYNKNKTTDFYDGLRRQESEQEEQIRSRKVSKAPSNISIPKSDFVVEQQGLQSEKNDKYQGKYQNSYEQQSQNRESESPTASGHQILSQQQRMQNKQEIQIPITQQQREFNQYFLEQNRPYNTEYITHEQQQCQTPIHKLYRDQVDSKQNFENHQHHQRHQHQQIKAFTFSQNKVQIHDGEYVQHNNYNNPNKESKQYNSWYKQKQLKQQKQSKQQKQLKQQKQYTFSDNKKDHRQEQSNYIQNHHIQQDEAQDNKLSFTDEWYINKNANKEPSTFDSLITQQQETNSKKKKTADQLLEQECQKSTSELDADELQVAKYSLIKAARDSAVQQRQRNKIYQRSVYQAEPYDQQTEAIGEVKRCECSIY